MKYGLPYKGSKNKLAERIVRLLPKRTNLVDLFCGGCAVSHAALVMGKYEHIHINDLNWMAPTLFIDALNGKYNNDTRWISREDFFRLRDTDPYVAVVWSFGNNLRDYLYSQEIEPLKKAIHYAIFFSDYSLGKALGHDLSFIDPIKDVQRRYVAVKRYFSQYGHFQQQSLERGGYDASRTLCSDSKTQLYSGGQSTAPVMVHGRTETPRLQSAEAVCRLNTNLQSFGGGKRVSQIGSDRKKAQYLSEYHPLERSMGGGCSTDKTSGPRNCNTRNVSTGCLQSKKKKICKRPWEAEHRERANSIAQASVSGASAQSANHQGGGQNLPITSSVLDYAEVEIPKDSVIYCDIPYEGTNVYNGAEHFDYERFYDWAERQTEPVFISSYQMPPDRFDCIQEWSHRSTLNDRLNNAVTERIFVPRHQAERGNIVKQLSLDLFSE